MTKSLSTQAYEFLRLSNPEQLLESFRLRYQVYCRECGFLREADYSHGYETDEYDDHSIHFSSIDTAGKTVGSVRLILSSCHVFPFERFVQPALKFPICRMIRRQQCAEISRFVVSKSVRIPSRKSVFKTASHAKTAISSAQVLNPVFFGLTKKIYEECMARDIDYCFAMMEKTFYALTRLYGFRFEPIGPEVDYYGVVRPYVLDVREHGRRGLFGDDATFFSKMGRFN